MMQLVSWDVSYLQNIWMDGQTHRQTEVIPISTLSHNDGRQLCSYPSNISLTIDYHLQHFQQIKLIKSRTSITHAFLNDNVQ